MMDIVKKVAKNLEKKSILSKEDNEEKMRSRQAFINIETLDDFFEKRKFSFMFQKLLA